MTYWLTLMSQLLYPVLEKCRNLMYIKVVGALFLPDLLLLVPNFRVISTPLRVTGTPSF